LEKLWKNWYNCYLLALREKGGIEHRQKRGAVTRCPQVGEVVIVCDEDQPRGSWKIGRVSKLLASSDKATRSVEVRLANGTVLRRAVNCVVPLEIDGVGDSTVQVRADSARNEVTTRSTDSDDAEFFGFSAEDVERTANAIRRFDAT